MYYISDFKRKELILTTHAKERFTERYKKIVTTMKEEEVESLIQKLLLCSKLRRGKTITTGKTPPKRDRIGPKQMSLENDYFRFIIRDDKIITITIIHPDFAHLN